MCERECEAKASVQTELNRTPHIPQVQPQTNITRKGQVRGWLVGDTSGGGTPGPIPNPAVKLTSVDGTARVTGWESRLLPTYPSRFSFLAPVCRLRT